ncbi:MIO [Mytilus edulis]|uniref:MIOS n=1 Tax=Mytilus edulis TaxID=6550 RepID=A0A8S3VEG4_MYTED|nr:MIO [Mytilus edulis]
MADNLNFGEYLDEIFADEDSDYEFEGFDLDDVNENPEVVINECITNENWVAGEHVPLPLNFSGSQGFFREINDKTSPIEYFENFINDQDIQEIVQETNLYAAQSIASKNLDISEYWTTDPVTSTPFFRDIMARDRFYLLLTFFHLNNNENNIPRGQDGHDPLFKLGTLYHNILHRFQSYYYPGQNLTIDECMVPWRGNLSFKTYNPDKPSKYGLKAYMLCDSKNGFCSKFKLYTGKPLIPHSSNGATYDLTMDLLRGHFGKGHILYCDNYYSSPQLFSDLWELGVGATGTVRPNRKGVPDELKNLKLRAKGETAVVNKGPLNLTKYLDHKPVYMLSTVSTSENIDTNRKDPRTGENIIRPKVVFEYNSKMGGVDRSDQMISYCKIPIKTLKWWKKILTLQEPKNIVKLRWCPTRNGFLGVLYRESTSVKLYDIRHTPQGIDELEPNYIDRTISPNNGGQYVTAFNWHPKQENRLLIACTNGAIKDMIVHERIPVIFSPQFHITWGNGKKLVDQELKSTDISLLMKERASKGYGLQSDHVFHNVQLVKEDAKLYGMWRWLSLSHDMVEEHKSQGQSYKHSGVYHLMDFNKGSTMKYQSFQYTDGSTGTKYFMRQYLSEERDKVLQLCGWGNSDNTEGLNLFLKELHKNGQTSKAAAIALFNLKFGQTIEILSGKYKHQAEDSTMMNAVAMAISGYSEDKQTLWRKTCSALLHKLTDPYLRAIFAFLSCEKDNYQEILDMKDLNLCDRVAFAALYLSDSKLQEFMESLIKEVKENGDLDGLLLTGLTSDGIDLLQRHLDRTGDIQTVALAIVYSLPCDITKEDKEKVVMWIQCYREMLDRWRLWHYRAKLDIIWHQNDTSTRVPSQAFISCNFCGKSIACNLPMVQRSLPFMSGPMAANFNRPKVTCCPGCRKPLPRCALCLTNLGTPSGTGLYHHKEKLGLDSKLSPFQDWFSWCQSCRHGGHVSHLFEWFDEHSECPVTGCTCNCVSRDHLERLSLKAVV